MRIICLSENEYGCGASIAGYRLAQGLARYGHTVHWWYSRPFEAGAPEREQLERRAFAVYPYFTLPERIGARLSLRLTQRFLARRWDANFAQLLTWVEEVQPDAVILNNVDRILNHAQVARLADRVPVYWLIHSNLAFEPWHYRFPLLDGSTKTAYTYDPRAVDTEALARLLTHPRLTYVTPSSWLEQHNRALHGEVPTIRRIPYGVDPRLFYPDRQIERRAGPLRVLFVSSDLSHPRKNLTTLLDAIELLPPDKFRFLALGRDTQGLVSQYPPLEFLPPSYDPAYLRRVYSEADVFVIPSLIDNLPNTVLESICCGTPVVGSRTGGVPDMVVPGVSGLLFDPYDAQDLARALTEYAGQRMSLLSGAALHTWAMERFGLEPVVRQWEALLGGDE